MCVYGDGGGRNSAKTVPVGAGDGLRQLLAFNDLPDGYGRRIQAIGGGPPLSGQP